MLGFLLSFLGLDAAAAANSGADDTPEERREVLAPPSPQEPDGNHTVDASTDDGHTDHGDDTVDASTDDGHTDHGDDTVDASTDDGHTDHGDDTVDASTDDGHTDHGDDTVDANTDDGHTDHGDDTVDASTDDGHTDHGDGGTLFEPTADLPETEAEIDAFAAAVRASPEMHVHDASSSKMGEHMAALNLVPRDAATHIAIGHGDWDDPSNWHNSEVPGDGARVLIPDGVHMTYDHISDARLFTVRVDGKLEFSTEVNSQIVVDTLVISPGGFLEIGTAEKPVNPNVDVDIIFANNGAIDTDWDPMLLSRGMIAHGNVEIHGAMKDSHAKVVDEPMIGNTWVDMGGAPEGWAVGDTIVIAGTHYDGYHASGYKEPEDEIRIITQIEDGMIFFDEPLVYNHDTPRADLKTSIANYTRNISFETENAETAEIYERGHVMFMHNDDVDVRYAEFQELGRTDKSEPARNVSEFYSIDFDTNVKGRYSFHFHRAGMEDVDDPGISIGNAVYGSPGWGFVHHDSNALLENNATYDTFGAGYVAESGNETGAWTDNIAIFAKGDSGASPKFGNDANHFDLGQTGDGFWFQGRMVASVDNVAASVNNGFVYFHRGPVGEDGQIRFDADTTDMPSLFHYGEHVYTDQHPILSFDGNEVFGATRGLFVLKANPKQGHDVHTVMEDFTAWDVRTGVSISYTSHYILKDFDIIGREASDVHGGGKTAITFGGNTFGMTIIDAKIENIDLGIFLGKDEDGAIPADVSAFTIIDPTFIDVDNSYGKFDPTIDRILTTEDLPMLSPDITLDGPLTYKYADYQGESGAYMTAISGTKTDSLGQINFPTEAETFKIGVHEMISLLEERGYFTTSDGQNYVMSDIFFSDRLTGDIYMERHPVLLDDNVPLETASEFWDVEFNGVQDLGGADDPTIDSAILWATLTDGQFVLSDEAFAI